MTPFGRRGLTLGGVSKAMPERQKASGTPWLCNRYVLS